MSLNTRIKTIDLINSKQSFEFNQSGNLNIKYGCNFTDAKNGIDYDSLSMIENNILTFNMSINFDYQAECGRCLSVNTINSKNARDFSLNLDAENDYELDLESEFIDFEPFISEMIIEKLELNYLLNTADLIFDVSNHGSTAKIKIADSIATTPRSLSGTDLNIA